MYNGPNLETTNDHQQENEDAIVVYSHSEIFLSIKKEWITDTCDNIDES